MYKQESLLKIFTDTSSYSYQNVMSLAKEYAIPPAFIISSYLIESGQSAGTGDREEVTLPMQNYFHIKVGEDWK